MSNGILKRQNDANNISKLAAQKQLYSDINLIEIVNILLTVMVPVTLSLIYGWSENEHPCIAFWSNTVACCLSLLMVIISPIIDNVQKSKRTLAATIQQQFDIDVFTMNWDEKLFGQRKNLSFEIASASKKILENKKKKKKLENWYREEVDELSLEEGIAACQKENFNWDRGLRIRYIIFLSIILVIILIVQVIIALVNDNTLREFICFGMFSVLSALTWIIKTINEIMGELNRLKTVGDSVYSMNKKDIDELTFIQRDIFECRQSFTKIPNWFYRLFKNCDEDRERRVMQMMMGSK